MRNEQSRSLPVCEFCTCVVSVATLRDFGRLWQPRGSLTSAGTPIQNALWVKNLLDAIQLPRQLAVIKCSAHTKVNSPVQLGNARADSAAKAAAASACLIVPNRGNQARNQVPALGTKGMPEMTEVQNLQRDTSDSEPKLWKSIGCSHFLTQDLWLTPVRQVCIPDSLLPVLIDYLHSCTHLGKEGMLQLLIKTWWHPDLNTAAQMRLDRCLICMKNNKGKGIKCPSETTPLPSGPFACIQLDFIESPNAQCYKYCSVMIDVFSKWIEAFPVGFYAS